MRCLVTGVAGFVGSSLAERLLGLGYDVVGVDSFVPYYPRSIKEANLAALRQHHRFLFVEGDLTKIELAPVLKDISWIFHQAAQAGVRASWGSYFSSYTTNNILATQLLLEAVKQSVVAGNTTLQKIVYASSSSVYGNAESFPTSELLTPHPVSPYGVTKLAAEHLMCLYATEFGVPTTSLRYFTVYGPRQRPDMAFHRFLKAAVTGKEIVLYGDGEQSRDFTYIDDIVSANIAAAERGAPGSVFNIGGGSQVTVNQILKTIEGLTNCLNIKREDRQVGDARHTSADTTRAKTTLGFSPRVSLTDGIGQELAWVRAQLKSGVLS